MLDHSQEAFSMISGKQKQDLKKDRMLELALVRLIKGVKKEVFPTVCTQMMTSLTLTVALFFVYLFQ
jgi:hypothetical protein